MEQHQLRRPRRTAATFLVALTALGLAVPPAGAVEDVASERLAGDDRFETAAEIAAAAFPDGSATVVIASGRAFPDALSGAALGLPILLTEPTSLPAATAAAIDDLEATDAIILGGPAAVSAAVEAEIAEQVETSRLAGTDRYETAAKIATSVGADAVGEVEDLRTAIIATGKGFADALAGGPLATGGDDVLPILLVEDSTPGATAEALNELDIEQVLILGGTAAVSPAVETQLEAITGNDAVRLAGGNRYATAVAVAEFALDTLEFPGDEILLANGVVFADALAGGPLGGVLPAPLLLTPVQPLAPESESFLEDHADTVETITTLGGPAAVANSTAAAAETAAESEAAPPGPSNETIEVTPQATEQAANGSSREYTVRRLTGPVDIALLECADVTRGAGTATTFRNTNANTMADSTALAGGAPDEADAPNARISNVNGTDRQSVESPAMPNDDYVNNAAPSAGIVTFVVTGPSASSTASVCVQPVVFVDANVDNALNVQNATTTPSESFGVGGQTSFSRSAAGAGQFTPHNVMSFDKTANQVTACNIVGQSGTNELVDEDDCKSFFYDANDQYEVGGTTKTLAEWEAALSIDDDLQGTYSAQASGVSVFNLLDEDGSGGAPLIIQADGHDDDGDKVVEEGDQHRLTFSEALVPTAATSGSYTVKDAGSPIPTEVTFTCGDNAVCTLASTVLTVSINDTPALPDGFDNPGSDGSLTYPLTIIETSGFRDSAGADGKETNLAGSTDVRIEDNTFSEQRPYITTAKMAVDTVGAGNYGAATDAMDLTFSEAVNIPSGADISEVEFEAITGRDVTYGTGTVTASQPSANVIRLTVGGSGLTAGIDVGAEIDGTSNTVVVDAAGNPQQPNPTINPTLQSI